MKSTKAVIFPRLRAHVLIALCVIIFMGCGKSSTVRNDVMDDSPQEIDNKESVNQENSNEEKLDNGDTDTDQDFIIPMSASSGNNSAQNDTMESQQRKSIIEKGQLLQANQIYNIVAKNIDLLTEGEYTSQFETSGCLAISKKGNSKCSFLVECVDNDSVVLGKNDSEIPHLVRFYDYTQDTASIDNIALFVCCFHDKYSYLEMKELLKTQCEKRGIDTYETNSEFAIDGTLFYVINNGGPYYYVCCDDKSVNYAELDPGSALGTICLFGEFPVKLFMQLSNEEKQAMVDYYKEHEMEARGNMSELVKLAGFSLEEIETRELDPALRGSNKSDGDDGENPEQTHSCEECGKSASHSVELFGILEWYCEDHYKAIMKILDTMEGDVGESNSSEHTCDAPGCNKEGTRQIIGVSGENEYYCTEHYQELKETIESLKQ